LLFYGNEVEFAGNAGRSLGVLVLALVLLLGEEEAIDVFKDGRSMDSVRLDVLWKGHGQYALLVLVDAQQIH